jgi:hypothetical protein
VTSRPTISNKNRSNAAVQVKFSCDLLDRDSFLSIIAATRAYTYAGREPAACIESSPEPGALRERPERQPNHDRIHHVIRELQHLIIAFFTHTRARTCTQPSKPQAREGQEGGDSRSGRGEAGS